MDIWRKGGGKQEEEGRGKNEEERKGEQKAILSNFTGSIVNGEIPSMSEKRDKIKRKFTTRAVHKHTFLCLKENRALVYLPILVFV